MNKLTVCPSTLAEGYDTYSPVGVKDLFNRQKVSHIMEFSFKMECAVDKTLDNVSRISLSGVQEKHSAIVEMGRVVLTPKGGHGGYILKPIPMDKGLRNRQFLPANEHLTMQIAKQIFDIETAECGIIFFTNNNPTFITKRFDIAPDGTKINQEDFASLIGKTKQTDGAEFKYQGSYEEVANELKRRVGAYPVELARFYNQIVFNYIFGNNDAHLKNFSLMQTSDGDYRLTPAYDLLNATLHVEDSDFALDGGLSTTMEYSDSYDRSKHPTRADFEHFGTVIGLNKRAIQNIISLYIDSDNQQRVRSLVKRSFLDEKMQRVYLRSYDQRMSRFNREV